MNMANPLQTTAQFEAQKEIYVNIFGVCFSYEDENGHRWNLPPHKVVVSQKNIVSLPKERKFWLSIQKEKSSLFSRRNGYKGRLVAGYSICLRLFNKNVL